MLTFTLSNNFSVLLTENLPIVLTVCAQFTIAMFVSLKDQKSLLPHQSAVFSILSAIIVIQLLKYQNRFGFSSRVISISSFTSVCHNTCLIFFSNNLVL